MDEHIQELWTQYLSGEDLAPGDERELLAALRADPDLRAKLFADERLDGMLHAAGRGNEDADSFSRSVSDRLAAEGSGRKFISGVRKKVQVEAEQRQPASSTRTTRSLRRSRRSIEAWSPAALAVAAIAALVVLGIVFHVMTQKPPPDVAEKPPEKIQPVPLPAPPIAPVATGKIIGKLAKVEGDVVAIVKEKRSPAISGQDIVADQGLELGANAYANVALPDGTRIDVKPRTAIRQIADNENGKRIVLSAGSLDASVAKQLPDRPLIIETPNAELKVIGTKFSVLAAAASTRLDVREGKVRLTRTADNAAVEVTSGQYVLAEGTLELSVRKFGPPGGVITTKTGPIDSLAFSPDGRWLIAGCYDNNAHLYNTEVDEPPRVLVGHNARVRSVAFSHDGKLLATGSWDKSAIIWDAETAKPLFTLPCRGNIWAVAFTPDDKALLTGDFAKRLRFWDTRTGDELPAGADPKVNEVLAIEYSPSGKLLAVGGTKGNVVLYDADWLKERRTLKGELVIESVSFSHDETMLAVAAGNDVRIWNVATGKLLQTMTGHSQSVRCVRFSHDDATVISVSDDTTVKLWEVTSGNCFATLTGHKDKVNGLAIAPFGDVFVTAGAGQTIRFWHLDKFRK